MACIRKPKHYVVVIIDNFYLYVYSKHGIFFSSVAEKGADTKKNLSPKIFFGCLSLKYFFCKTCL